MELVDEPAVVAVGVLAGHVEQGLGDRERGAQLVRGVGGEPLLLGDLRLEAREHVSNPSASSRNSSVRPSSRIRCESDPVAAIRVASVILVRGASIRPARNHPPTRPKTSRTASAWAARGAKASSRSERVGLAGPGPNRAWSGT